MSNKTLKYKIALFLLVLLSIRSFGQQDPIYHQYMFNVQAYNPAYVGSWDNLGIMSLGRYQWVGFGDGAPHTYTLAIQSPLRNRKIGVGLSVISDQIGYQKSLSSFIDYSYRLKLSKTTFLRLGLKGGFTNYTFDLDQLEAYPSDESDPVLSIDKYNNILLNFGVGAYLSSETFYVGYSIPKILQNGIGESNNEYEMRSMTLIGGFVFPVGSYIKVKPSFCARYEIGLPVVADINATLILRDRVWLGAMYRTSEGGVGINANFVINDKLRFGYAYEFLTTSGLANYQSGSHEVMVSYEISFEKTTYTSPRAF